MVMKCSVAWGFFVWMGGFFGLVLVFGWVFLHPCGTVQVCRLRSERQEFYAVLGLPVALAPLSISETPGIEDDAPYG